MSRWTVKQPTPAEPFEVTAPDEETARARGLRRLSRHATVEVEPVGVEPPPPPPPPPVDLPEFTCPRTRGAAGTSLPKKNCPDFDGAEYAGVTFRNGQNERMTWVKDPGGSNTTVIRIHMLKDDDSGVSPAGHRCELYSQNRDMNVGVEYWECLVFRCAAANKGYLGSARKLVMFSQHHAPSDAKWGSPPQTLGFDLDSNTIWLRNKPHSSESITHTLAPGAPDQWLYVVVNSKTVSDSSGFCKAWAKAGGMPNVSGTPAYSESGIYTNNGGRAPTRAHIGFYFDDSPYPELDGYVAYYGRGSKDRVLGSVPVLGN
jgi:hypothetical protein